MQLKYELHTRPIERNRFKPTALLLTVNQAQLGVPFVQMSCESEEQNGTALQNRQSEQSPAPECFVEWLGQLWRPVASPSLVLTAVTSSSYLQLDSSSGSIGGAYLQLVSAELAA